jgi:acyl dehydratase
MVSLSFGSTTLGTLVANLCYYQLTMPNPVFIVDTLRAETAIVEACGSKSRPEAGVVTFKHVLLNQRDERVCQCLRHALIKKRPA